MFRPGQFYKILKLYCISCIDRAGHDDLEYTKTSTLVSSFTKTQF
jgi:hypothetical protein